MKDEDKPKEQLIMELHELRKRLAESEKDKDERKRVEDALRKTQQQLKLILDAVPAMIWQKDRKGTYMQVNKVYCRTVGRSENDILGKTDYDLFPAELADQYVDDDRRILSSGIPQFGVEEQHQKPSGERGWSRTDKMVYCDTDGRVAGTIGFALDMTERKRTEDALRESEERLRTLSDNLPDGMVYQIDSGKDGLQRRFSYLSAGVERLHGITAGEAMSDPMTIYGQVVEEDRQLVAEREAAALVNLTTFSVEVRFRLPTGGLRWHHLSSAPRRLANDHLVWDGIEIDVTDRKRAEDALRESESRAKAMLLAIPDLMFRMDSQGVFLDYKADISDLYAQSAPTIIGKRNRDLTPPEFADLIDRQIRATLETRTLQTFEYQLSLPGRGVRDYEARMVASGAEEVTAIVRDITERTRLERERLVLDRRLLNAQKAESLGRMAGAIAHHFNNQLGVVMGNLEMALFSFAGDAPIRENLAAAMKAARRSSEISGLMLTYLGQSAGKREPLDLSELCRQYLPMLRQNIPESVTLETDLLSTGPFVRANANQMKQILTHLITNGWESIGRSAGKVTLATRTIPASQVPQSHLAPIGWNPTADIFGCIEVKDTGCGMGEQDVDKIFDPFFTTKFTGRGLGLAVVSGIVKAWDGAILVESTKDQGSTFRVFLPLTAEEVSRPSEKTIEARQVGEGLTVLLVEDQDMVRDMAESMLKVLGLKVVAASGGGEAVELLREKGDQIRCVITDLTMPGMDGWDTISALRKIRPHIPVILASGYDEAQAMAGNYPEQPQVFLHKPYSMSELKNVLTSILMDEAKEDD